MLHVLFVAPFGMETTLRFVRAAADLSDVRLGVISQEPLERFPEDVRARIHDFARVKSAMQASELAEAVRAVARDWDARIDRLIGILEQLQEPLAEVREELGIRGMDRREARNFRDKAVMKDELREHGLPCARHHLATTPDAALAFTDECLPLVVKPPAGAGARNTMRVNAREDLEDYLRSVPVTVDDPLLLEEFIVGREHSFDTVTLHGQHVFHSISRYYPTPLEVMEQPWLQWCVMLPREIDGPEYDDIRAAGFRALDVLGMHTGMTHMEWFRRPDGSIAISEVAARPPGAQFTSLISWAHGLDFYAAWARLSIFAEFDPPARTHAVGAVFLRGQGGRRVARVHGLDEAQAEMGELVVQAKLPRPGQPKASDYEGEGYVILRHPDTDSLEHALRRVLELIRVDLE